MLHGAVLAVLHVASVLSAVGSSEQLLPAAWVEYGNGVCKIPVPPSPSQLQLGHHAFLTSDSFSREKITTHLSLNVSLCWDVRTAQFPAGAPSGRAKGEALQSGATILQLTWGHYCSSSPGSYEFLGEELSHSKRK